MTPRDRFMTNVRKDPETKCWNWTASLQNGYGITGLDGRTVRAHRASYILFKGPIPPGALIRHRCHNRKCVNPEHLIPGTHQENMDDRKGRPLNIKKPMKPIRGSAEARFMVKVQKDPMSGCWLWTGSFRQGYGAFDGKWAHVESYKMFKGPIEKGLMVRHTCDVKECVNPDHLILGTHEDNMKDVVDRGAQLGENNGFSKLTWKEVREIRASSDSVKVLAKRYNIAASGVYHIITGRAWKEPGMKIRPAKTRLTEEQYREIYKSTKSRRDLAAEYNLSESMVSIIRRRAKSGEET